MHLFIFTQRIKLWLNTWSGRTGSIFSISHPFVIWSLAGMLHDRTRTETEHWVRWTQRLWRKDVDRGWLYVEWIEWQSCKNHKMSQPEETLHAHNVNYSRKITTTFSTSAYICNASLVETKERLVSWWRHGSRPGVYERNSAWIGLGRKKCDWWTGWNKEKTDLRLRED